MKVRLKDFQVEAVATLRNRFDKVKSETADDADDEVSAVLLNAPTGSGKTMIATALIEELLAGSESDGSEGDPYLTFLWLTDQPELNEQTYDKMSATSNVLGKHNMTIIDTHFEAERLEPGQLYFLNTQKLGANSSLVRTGDDRHVTIWQTLRNTLEADPARLVLVLDEAHRGARGSAAEEATTIMQRFIKGSADIPMVPVVVGISATPDRFVSLCEGANRTVRKVDVPAAVVRESGLLKEYVDLYHPDEGQPSDATMLNEAIATWQQYNEQWAEYRYSDGEEPVVPILLVQVRDATKASGKLSVSDLDHIVGTLASKVDHDPGDTSWLAHA